MIKYLISTLVVFSTMAMAAKKDLLQGYWVFQESASSKELKPEDKEMVKKLFGETTFHFKSDGKYNIFMMGKNEDGTWDLNKDETIIVLTSSKGNVSDLPIKEVNEEKLLIDLGSGTLIMKKGSAPSDEQSVSVPKKEYSTTSATVDQVAKKWLIKSKEDPDKTVKQSEMGNALLNGSFFQYSKNGKYKMEIIGMKEAGTWKFGPNNSSIINEADGGKKIWNIHKISDKEMVLTKGEEKWTFVSE